MTIVLKLDENLDGRVRGIADRTHRSTQSIVRKAVEQYVAREEARESFKQEAIESGTAFQQTGRHLTGGEARAWIRRWDEDAPSATPDCHD